jgi:LysR family transcriptional regulator, glycine cleavage system transcriptional activator
MPAMPAAPLFPHVRLPSIDGLLAFEAAARLGTFERAADELAVSASAVGKRIATLEELLGTPLFLRTGKALALTVAGREYLEQVRAALGLLAAVPLHHRQAQRRQRLRVTAPPTFARQLLVPRLAEFTEAHPELEMELALSIPFIGGEGADTDIEIGHRADLPDAGQVLMHDRVLPLATPALRARLPAAATPADLAGLPLLRTPIDPWTPWLRAAGLDWPEPTAGPRLVDLGLVLEAAAAGQGVALARPTLARQWLDAGTLVPLWPLSVPASHAYRLHPHAADGAAPRFAAWLRGVCAEAEHQAAEWLSGLG